MCGRHEQAARRPARALSALRVAQQTARSPANPEGTADVLSTDDRGLPSDRIHDDHLSLELSRILHFEPGLHDCHSATEGGLPSALHRRRDQVDDRLPANSTWLRRQPTGYQCHGYHGHDRRVSLGLDRRGHRGDRAGAAQPADIRSFAAARAVTAASQRALQGQADRGGRRIKV
jgi:hypothetical protein